MALALPTKYGQSLSVEKNNSGIITWKSYDEHNKVWFEDHFAIDGKILKQIENGNAVSDRLVQILKIAQDLNPNFLSYDKGFNISTHLDFNRKWGLGTSSTLINNIAQWAKIDAYTLLNKTFGGSSYDIACAQNNTPITYQLNRQKRASVESVAFNPSFKNNLYFVYLNQKQNSRDGIRAYKTLNADKTSAINTINEITLSIIDCKSLSGFEALINEHEALVSKIIMQAPVKTRLFKDYNGAIKSLGAWGGDFILATSKTDPTDYFSSKGFKTVVPYRNMILETT